MEGDGGAVLKEHSPENGLLNRNIQSDTSLFSNHSFSITSLHTKHKRAFHSRHISKFISIFAHHRRVNGPVTCRQNLLIASLIYV